MARRRGDKQPNALVAAASRIDLTNPRMAEKQAAKRESWQAEAWAYFDEVPELKEAIRYRGNQLAKLRLFVATENPDDPKGDPIPVEDPDSGVPTPVAAAASTELARLHGEYGGQGAILAELDMNHEVVGECYLVGIGEHERTETVRGVTMSVTVPEDWQIRSISEVFVRDGRYVVKDSPNDTGGRELDPENDSIMRLWLRHPQWSSMPDSPMRGLLGECRTLQVLSQQVLAQAMRSVSAGFWAVPNELSFGPNDQNMPESEDEPERDPLNQALHDVLVRPIDNPSDPSTVQPGIFRGAAEFLQPQYLRHIKFYDPALDTVLEQKIEARVQRIARGLNLPVEKVMGHQQTTFANAAQVDEDEFNDYLRPSADSAVDALTYAFLVPQLREAGLSDEWTDGTLFVWYDATELIAQPDKEKNADGAHDRLAISDASYRAAKGFGEDDAPDELELLTRTGLRRGLLGADVTAALLELLGVDIDLPEPAAPIPGEPVPTVEDQAAQAALLQLLTAAGKQRAARPRVIETTATLTAAAPNFGRMLTDIDRDLRTRLVQAAGAAMDRALDRASNVLRSKANGTPMAATLRKIKKTEGFAHLGPSLVAEVLAGTDPLAGAWDELRDQFMTWGANAQAQAVDIAGQVASGFTTSLRSELKLRQADDLATAWQWMEGSLTSLANAKMFDPASLLVQTLGEFDPSLKVPTGLVREAISLAGGATGISTEQGGAWLALTDAGTRPAGGIGTGELLRGAMRDGGAQVEGYVWVYGPAFRQHPFEPHQSLDGITFLNFDDPVLANTSGFPEFGFYMPGDHAGSLAAGTVVSGPAPRGAALRHWRGDLTDLAFVSGQFLSATPNHPILTRRGWVAAGDLVEGDEVVRCSDAEGIAGLVPDDCQVPSRIEDVVASVAVSDGVLAARVKVAPVNFHGDGEGSEVAVVWSDRLLSDGDDPAVSEPASQPAFTLADAEAHLLACDGGGSESSGRVGAAPLGSVSGGGHRLALLRGPLSVLEELRGGQTAGVDSGSEEPFADAVPVDAETLGESILGLSGLVEMDKVIRVDVRRGFSGHVYDLQTGPRWYVANGVIVHNCVCDFEPVLLSATDAGTGMADGPGPGLDESAGQPVSLSTELTSMMDRYEAEGVRSWVSEDFRGHIHLDQIIVPDELRGSGIGTRFMEELTAHADAHGAPIQLTPSGDYGGTVSRLVDFYKRFGFVENKGRAKDLSISDSMYRLPKEMS